MKIFYDNSPLFDLEVGERGPMVMEVNLRFKGIIWENLEKSFAKLVAQSIVEGVEYEETVRGWIDFGIYITNITKPATEKFDETKLFISEMG